MIYTLFFLQSGSFYTKAIHGCIGVVITAVVQLGEWVAAASLFLLYLYNRKLEEV